MRQKMIAERGVTARLGLAATGASRGLHAFEVGTLKAYKASLDDATRFIPLWVKVAVAIALGLGTMIGWKRIVVTVGEKIGKQHLTYAQGASAELVAMGTIFAADAYGLPVSTTHVLSSGVARTMAANGSAPPFRDSAGGTKPRLRASERAACMSGGRIPRLSASSSKSTR